MNWRQRVWMWWDWIKWTPVLLAVVVIVLSHTVGLDDSQLVIDIWGVVSIGSIFFVTLLWRRTKRLVWMATRDRIKAEQVGEPRQLGLACDELIHTRNLHSNTTQILNIHILFFTLALANILPLPEWLEDDIGITALMTGQFILFLIAVRSYLAIILAWHGTPQDMRTVMPESSIAERLDKAATEAEDRFAESELEKTEVRSRLETQSMEERTWAEGQIQQLNLKLDYLIDLLVKRAR